jgi:S-DNA-T family DNA segregation ATPase FtsK/SpoIIIE
LEVGPQRIRDEHGMSRSDQRRTAIRLALVTLGLALSAFLWTAVVSYSPADWPSASVWPVRVDPANVCGVAGAFVAYHLLYYLGIGVYVLLALLTLALVALARGVVLADLWLRLLGLGVLVTAVAACGAMLLPPLEYFPIMGAGGVLGMACAHFFESRLDTLFTLVLLGVGVLVGLLLAADELFFGATCTIRTVGRQSALVLRRGGRELAGAGAALASGAARLTGRPGNGAAHPKASETAAGAEEKAVEEEEEVRVDRPTGPLRLERHFDLEPVQPASREDGPVVREVGAGGARKKALGNRTAGPADSGEGGYRLPPWSLLGEPERVDKGSVEILCREKAYTLEQTLNEFKIEVKVVAIETGPVITVFELKLAPGVKVSQINSLTNDLARALKAPAVRVVAPLPGKNTIGIEVPNVDKEKVRLRELLRTAPAEAESYAIPLYLGKDASGAPLVSDLTRMPHLLIAGTTGSGKSVCVSSIIMSILMTRTPAQVNLILVDPKVVELAVFKDIPHLICPIVTEVSRAEGLLDWAATKMDERYALLAEAGVKDIRSYNRLGEQGLRERMQIDSDDELAAVPLHLPYIVIVVDELADLMMTSAKEVEFYLCRLAQKSRAVGIHLIVSTQRPQANVVTGLIKSNLPCRLCFRVASRLDSRIVLDQNGGEVLMGQGDMLFLPPGSSKLVRAQGTYISEEELRETVRHCRAQGQPRYHPELVRMPGAGESDGERDELFDQAVDIILETGRGSVSLLQRRLMIGYGRASRLIDQMYAAGIVGEYKGSQAREIIMSREEWEQIRAQREREEAEEQEEG